MCLLVAHPPAFSPHLGPFPAAAPPFLPPFSVSLEWTIQPGCAVVRVQYAGGRSGRGGGWVGYPTTCFRIMLSREYVSPGGQRHMPL